MDVCLFWVSCVVRVLCEGLITRPGESYRLWCVTVCDLETSRTRRPWQRHRESSRPTWYIPPQTYSENMFTDWKTIVSQCAELLSTMKKKGLKTNRRTNQGYCNENATSSWGNWWVAAERFCETRKSAQMNSSVFWVTMRRKVVSNRRFGCTYRSHLQDLRCLGTSAIPRNITAGYSLISLCLASNQYPEHIIWWRNKLGKVREFNTSGTFAPPPLIAFTTARRRSVYL
jgi:hypothetical protein